MGRREVRAGSAQLGCERVARLQVDVELCGLYDGSALVKGMFMVAAESLVQRTKVVWINAAVVVGLLIGFRISVQVTAEWTARIAVFWLAFFNLLIFVVAPRLTAAKAEGGIGRNPYGELWAVVSARPAVTVLCCIQLWCAARSLATALTMFRTSTSDYVRGLPNSGNIHARLIASSIVMFFVGMLWLLGAIGLWRIRRWAWWLALCLNGLASATTIVLQAFVPHEFLVDIGSTVAIIVLLLPLTRRVFHIKEEPPSATT